jgi:hypothetical protein
MDYQLPSFTFIKHSHLSTWASHCFALQMTIQEEEETI